MCSSDLIECTSRPPGQHMVELMHRSYGFDLMDISISLATGEPVTQQPTPPRKHYALFGFYSMRDGILREVRGLEELQARGGVSHLFLTAKPGDQIRSLSTFREKYGFMVIEDDTALGMREKADWMRENVFLELEPEESEEEALVSQSAGVS